MTAPGPLRGLSLAVGDRRGLTAAGGVIVALLLALVGAAVDLGTGSGLREVFAVGFVSGCLLAAAAVHREDLKAAVVMPPLVYVVVALAAGAVESTSASGSFLMQQAVGLANTVVLGAPVLVSGTLAALVTACVRWLAVRR